MEKFAENYKISQEFGISRQNLDKIHVQQDDKICFLRYVILF